jgi:asparagine synthase (glutamine-hydrolysing)
MCGICGILTKKDVLPAEEVQTLIKMRDVMTYRGPDDAGHYIDATIGLGSRRLSIIDLSERGHMPMTSSDGRYIIIYNGEVYNHSELREHLEKKGWVFRSKSDTEVILTMYMEYGPEMLSRLNGMFAIAIWDRVDKSLFLARDRMGVKPLYYTEYENRFYFASEEKAFFVAGVPCIFEEKVWHEILFFRYIAGELTPYRNIKRLLPGHYMLINEKGLSTNRWWDLRKSVSHSSNFRELFDESIRLRLISDVPVGLLLSGGLDSSAMTAVTSLQAGTGVNSFTVRFYEKKYDEGLIAHEVAQKCGAQYHEQYILPSDIPSLLQDATWYLDEPLIHGNDPHLLSISRYAKPRVTVLLSGEGADEVLGGYVRYRPFLYPGLLNIAHPIFRSMSNTFPSNERLRKAAEIFLIGDSSASVLFSSADVFPDIVKKIPSWDEVFGYRMGIIKEAEEFYPGELVRQVMYYDQHTYLQSVLDRNDRMTMGASIECREPFLDVKLVEWAAHLPTRQHFNIWAGKKTARRAMRGLLPESVLRHKKWGFGVPWGVYLRKIPSLRKVVVNLPKNDFVRSGPLSAQQLKDTTSRFLDGDDSFMALIRILSFTAIWHEVCVHNRRNYLDEILDERK